MFHLDATLQHLEPLEADPKGVALSRKGATEELVRIAREYVSLEETVPKAIRIGRVGAEWIQISKLATALADAIDATSDYGRIWFHDRFSAVTPHPMTTTIQTGMYEDVGWEMPMGGSLNGERHVAQLQERLRCLEHLAGIFGTELVKQDKGGKRTAATKYFGDPNLRLVKGCRILLAACGKKHGGGKSSPIARLALDVREMATRERLGETAFNAYVREVVQARDQLSMACLEAEALSIIVADLRTRRPEGHADLDLATRQLAALDQESGRLMGLPEDMDT